MKIILKMLFITIMITTAVFSKELVVFFTNDVHSRVSEGKQSIGYAKISGYINKLKETNKNVIYLDGGDTLHGTNFALLEKGKSVVEILNLVPLTAMAPGNHDYNYGYKRLKSLSKKAKFEVLAANVKEDKSGSLVFKPNMLVNLEGMKVGIFGLSTPETAYKTSPKNIVGLRFDDLKQTAIQQVADLKEQGADIIIAVGHMGIDDETAVYERSTILGEVEGIDLIVDGHSHSLINKPYNLKNGAYLVQSGEYGKYLGKITIKIDDNDFSKKQYSLTFLEKNDLNDVTPNPAIEKLITKYNQKQKEFLERKVGETTISLEGSREFVRKQETNLSQIIVDALREETKSDIAVINGGGIRESIAQGDITYQNIISVLPFANILVTTSITGHEIKRMLEVSVSKLPSLSGAFLHVSGMTFSVNLDKPVGSRVSNIRINGQKVNPNGEYIIALPDFVFMTTEGSDVFQDKKIISYYGTLDEIVYNSIKGKVIKDWQFEPRIKLYVK